MYTHSQAVHVYMYMCSWSEETCVIKCIYMYMYTWPTSTSEVYHTIDLCQELERISLQTLTRFIIGMLILKAFMVILLQKVTACTYP